MTNKTATVEGKRKSEIYQILNKFNSREVRAQMLEVIMEIRQVPKKEAQDIKTLKPSEVAAVLERFE